VGADRVREHFEAQNKAETVTHLQLRCEEVVNWATRGGSKALGLDAKIGSLEVGKRADVVLLKNDDSPVMFPIVNPYGHVVFQAGRGDVHTVVIDGRVVKHEHALVDSSLAKARESVSATVEFLQSELGDETWREGMYPEVPQRKIHENPYTYTTYDAGDAAWKKND
jgi:urease alpha subunit